MRTRLAAAGLLLAALNQSGPSLSAERVSDAGDNADQIPSDEHVIDLPFAAGGTQRVLYISPSRPRGTIVMLPGGTGDVDIERSGDIANNDNFVVRSRALWIARHYAALIPDAADHTNLRGLRSTPEYAALVGDFVAYAHAQTSGPVFLLGTSQGSIAAMNGAAHLQAGEIAGVVLTESVSREGASHETVFDAAPAQVTVPALVVANIDDRCEVAPPEDAPKIAAAMVHSPDRRVMTVSGRITRSKRNCGSLTPHGYYGIEAAVVTAIADWMDAHH